MLYSTVDVELQFLTMLYEPAAEVLYYCQKCCIHFMYLKMCPLCLPDSYLLLHLTFIAIAKLKITCEFILFFFG